MLGNDVYARPTFNDIGVHRYSEAQIVPLLNPLELTRQLVNRVYAFLRREAGMTERGRAR